MIVSRLSKTKYNIRVVSSSGLVTQKLRNFNLGVHLTWKLRNFGFNVHLLTSILLASKSSESASWTPPWLWADRQRRSITFALCRCPGWWHGSYETSTLVSIWHESCGTLASMSICWLVFCLHPNPRSLHPVLLNRVVISDWHKIIQRGVHIFLIVFWIYYSIIWLLIFQN
jgi:hypothetical protein